MKHIFTYQGKTYELTLIPTPDGYRIAYQGDEYVLTEGEAAPTGTRFRLNGVMHTLPVSNDRDTRWVAFDGRTYPLKRQTGSRRPHHAGDDNPEGVLRAPMPGQVRAVNVQTDDLVTKGQTLLLLEAMKMEIRIQAPCDGAVAKIAIAVGDQVDKEQILIEIQ